MKYRAALVVLMMLAACNPQPQHGVRATTPAPSAQASGVPPLTVTGPKTAHRRYPFVERKGGKVQYQLLADSYVLHSTHGDSRTTFTNVDVTFYDPSGSTLRAHAPRAVADEAAATVTLLDGVVARSSDGATMRCRTLLYNRATGRLHGEGDVRFSNKTGMAWRGNRFDSDDMLENVRMQ